ncbi:MAG: hypothetical protein A3G32_05455 [Deltaproteobacteria bacterium RIFCSPLOWO2_12_FULL_40_28]|nr:MAG: hypothetical protein A3C45_03625 [Deltaproteobacteria bacterium RIFCSPHIGHO2_02_FULL_40_28]OGQ18917.1 MAG: hypothetical protein A3E27_09455 [Deltaproteobacteria bacterium RIFCSPHIGHO2_12_FULL_40_32]OGQ39460.1 MAG: hypothetical protein A3I69_09570 [Deltaproteobacteria bacterium RIFCSPLOWO2_02_FULL_40_36]OGQ53350.1 MAG: hypothetical protein A3G32_05455 [Deltaproteobacteria bacterium RIFCSPLOWO2_12_FULL_40_28]
MTFNIPTSEGVVAIKAPFRLNKQHKAKIRKVFTEITSSNEPLSDENMESFLKRTTPDTNTPIGKIKGLLVLYNWTQKKLSAKSGLSVSIICDILKSRRPIGVTTAKKLARALNVDYHDFL